MNTGKSKGVWLCIALLLVVGVDPHLYKASESDVRSLEQADIIFYNGLHLEAGMAGVLERMNDQSTKTAAVTDGIDRSVLLAPPEFKGAYDPHVWFDDTLWMKATQKVQEMLSEVDPASAALNEQNTRAYLGQLEELHQYVKDQAERVPLDKRVLITAHDAFNCFGRAYGFEVRGLQGISTASEAGTLDMQELAEFIVERQIPRLLSW